ncbi:MAG: ACP S-malonyltransferase [Rickettsiales bacterium]|nr:ACP S-malonyltransferase [Rickettsiales bacterium]
MHKTVLMFPGQGSQKIGMGKELYNTFSTAKEIFQEIDDSLNQNLSKLMFDGDFNELTQTENTQPALMAVSIAAMRVIEKESNKKINEFCNFVCGHSLGEYSALAAARAITISDCAKILKIRGNAMRDAGKNSNGAMAAIIGVDIDIAKEIAKKSAENQVCEIANDNSVGQVVISGDDEAIERAIIIAKEHGAKIAVKLPVSGAFHSSLIKSAESQLADGLDKISLMKPEVNLVANVTAESVDNPSLIKELLLKQLTSVVRWRESLQYLANKENFHLAEIGAGKVLSGLAKRTNRAFKTSSIETPEEIKNFIEQNLI